MPRRLTPEQYRKKHSAVIDLAIAGHSTKNIATRTGKAPSYVSFLITTARQRGINIPYKTKQTRTNGSPRPEQKRNVNNIKQEYAQKLRDLLGKNHRPFNYRKVLQMFAKGASTNVVAKEIAEQLNIPDQKAQNIAQTIYYIRRMK